MLPASLILVSYRSAELTLQALRHLEALGEECPQQVIVVDNSPDRGLAELVHSQTHYLTAEKNLGFAGAVNLGLRHVDHEIVILLNPDARPQPECLAGLLECFVALPDVGIAGPALVSDGREAYGLPSATRVAPGLISLMAEHTILHRLMPNWLEARYFLLPTSNSGSCSAAMVQGACFAFRRKLLQQIGPFDEKRFFLYWEDTDFCHRARRAGWRIVFLPDLACVHFGGHSTPDRRAARSHYWYGLFAYQRKHRGWIYAALIRTVLVLGVGAEVAVLGALRIVRHNDEVLRGDFNENWRRLIELVRISRPEPLP